MQHGGMRPLLRHCFQPLNLAGLITWLAVLFSLRLEEGGWSPERLTPMLLFAAAFLIDDPSGRRRGLRNALLWVQWCLALFVIAIAPRTGTAAVLLVMVAAQMAMAWQPRHWIPVIAAGNVVFLVLMLHAGHRAPWLMVTIYLGFQAFAALIGHYARNAERTRDQLALVNADLLATRALLADSARDAERLRVARELHDVAGHKLTAMKLNLRALAAEPALAAHPQVRLCEQLAGELLGDIRGVVQALRDTRGLDLETALRALAAPLPTLQLSLRIEPGSVVHDPALADILLRTVQEALTNAVRHAQASELRVHLRREAGELVLHIEDDGQAPIALREGNGLAGMRERIAACDGTLTIGRAVHGGLTLDARIPA